MNSHLWTQHGSYQLQWQGDILVARYEGAWNEVASHNLHRDAKALWTARGTAPWGLLSDAREWESGTPEALAAWWAFFEDAVKHGLIAVSDVLPSSFHATIVKAIADRAHALANYRPGADIPSAMAWLESQGLRIA